MSPFVYALEVYGSHDIQVKGVDVENGLDFNFNLTTACPFSKDLNHDSNERSLWLHTCRRIQCPGKTLGAIILPYHGNRRNHWNC